MTGDIYSDIVIYITFAVGQVVNFNIVVIFLTFYWLLFIGFIHYSFIHYSLFVRLKLVKKLKCASGVVVSAGDAQS